MNRLPDLDDAHAMALAGRRSTLWHARKEACEALRDACVACQSADIADPDAVAIHATESIKAAERLIEVANLWRIATSTA